ncbi:prolactin regulatory element-binding protein [Belonocnema kinseyi]|uniref:prolactin regulatory element-binding protein n=1 Tax=Belonocnema kinseyi TaxID=2817044 RepID=UPI00143DF5FF|nr:prolactin regulatory element-binding protein [Belonocnema kinseyi]
MPRKNKGGLLARVNFPLYTIQILTSRHILVGGGGGSAKTGVANGFEIFELSHDGVQFIAEEVTRHETGPSVVMNCATYNDGKNTWIVAGQESHCQLYSVHSRVVTLENGDIPKKSGIPNPEGLRQRKKSERSEENIRNNAERVEEIKDTNFNVKSKKLQLIVKSMDSIQTDFGEKEALQRIVRVSPSGKVMVTGGTDGRVRIWKFPQLLKLHDMEAHTKEIDDMDFNPDGNLLASIAKDGRAVLWDVTTGTKNKELTWNPPGNAKYLYKRCRFSMSEEKTPKTQLFTLSNAAVGKNPSYLQLWDTEAGLIVKSVSFRETLSALAVSDNGRFVAVGTMFSGSVDIFIAFSLQRVLHVAGAHSMFVTGLEFLPTRNDGPAITSNAETAVVSISVDNRICVHSLPFRYTVPIWVVIVCIILSIFCAFVFCSYMGI